MSEAKAAETKQPDPMDKFLQLRNAYLEIWSKNLIETVNSEGYAKASGAALDTFLTVSAPFKETAEQAMLRTLQQLNMPTSVDFAGLAGRFTNIEMQSDNMDAKLDRIEKLLTGLKASADAAMPTESSTQAAPRRKAAPRSARTSEPAIASEPAGTTRQVKQSSLRARGTSKGTPSAKQLRRGSRKGAK